MHKLVEYICNELDELERKVSNGTKLSMAETEYLDVLAHAKKNLLKGEELYEEGYSNDGVYYGSYDGRGDSYARRGNSYARRRDSMGRYTRGYSRDDAREDMVRELRSLMAEAPDDRTRKEFERFIGQMESM